MPSNIIKKVVRETDLSTKEAENKWDKAEKAAKEGNSKPGYGLIMDIFKKKLGKSNLKKLGWKSGNSFHSCPNIYSVKKVVVKKSVAASILVETRKSETYQTYVYEIINNIYKYVPEIFQEKLDLIVKSVRNVINDLSNTSMGKKKFNRYFPDGYDSNFSVFREGSPWSKMSNSQQDKIIKSFIKILMSREQIPVENRVKSKAKTELLKSN